MLSYRAADYRARFNEPPRMRREGRIADQIREHHRDLAALCGYLTGRRQRAVGALVLNLRTQLCDCVANAQAVACARYANIFQHLVVNLTEQIDVEIVSHESIGILGEINRLQPFADLAHISSCSSSAFASFRSRVSNPSVNQP